MLRDRYEPMNLFDLVPTLVWRWTRCWPSSITCSMTTPCSRRSKPTWPAPSADAAYGRPSTPVEVILRMLVVKHLYGWSYEATERWVSDSLVLRQFCRVYAAACPMTRPCCAGPT